MLRTVLFFSLLASPALAFEARNGAHVSGTADRIIVSSHPGLGASDSWCAAGDFVIRGLGMSATTQVYRVSPPPRRAGEDVEFSLSPARATDRSGLLQLGNSDAALSAGHGQATCRVGRWGL